MTTKEAQMREIGEKIFQLIEDKFFDDEEIEVSFRFNEAGEFKFKLHCYDDYEIELEDE